MLSIGEFSHVCRTSIKTLRYYHDLGILKPAKVDESSGYRFYDTKSHERMTGIAVLKDLGFTLKEIKNILNTCKEETDLQEFIDSKLTEVEQKLKDLHALKDQLVRVRAENNSATEPGRNVISEFDFSLKCYAARSIRGSYSAIGSGFLWLHKAVGSLAIGKPYAFYHDLEYREEDASFQAVFELRKKTTVEGAEITAFPATRAVRLVHTGPYGSQGVTYAKLFAYCRKKGYTVKPPIIEHYVRGPGMIFQGNPRQYRTECILLLES